MIALIGEPVQQRLIFPLRQRLRPPFDRIRFLLPSGMAGIQDDRHDSSGAQQATGGVQRLHRRIRPGYDRMILSRQVSEIEHDRGYAAMLLIRDGRSHLGVAAQVEPDLRVRLLPGEARRRALQRLRLNIEGVHLPGSANDPGQKQRIYAIAGGGIDRRLPRLHAFGNQAMGEPQYRNETHGNDTPSSILL